MNLHVAQSMLVRDRMDWRKPHLSWVPTRIYRFFNESKN